MIRDARLTFGAPVTMNTGAAGTYNLGDVIDLTSTGRDIGAGEGVGDLFLYIAMATAGTGAGASAQFNLVTSDSPSLTSPTVIVGTPVTPVASLTGNTVLLAVRLPAALYKRYLGLQQVTSGAAFSAGSVNAFFVEDANAIRFYPQAFS